MSLLLALHKSAGAGVPAAYKYYRFVVTVWNDAWKGAGEIALYDDLGNLGNVGIGNGQLDIHGTSGLALAESATSGGADQAADGNNTTTRWLTNGAAGWWKFTFNIAPSNVILGYTYWSANSGVRSPNTFTFEGSNDDLNWDVLDSRSGQTWVGAYERKDFTIGA